MGGNSLAVRGAGVQGQTTQSQDPRAFAGAQDPVPRHFPRIFRLIAFFLLLCGVQPLQALQLGAELAPDPVAPGELFDLQITVANDEAGTSGTLTLVLTYPDNLNSTPIIAGGGTCSVGTSGCSPGEPLVWNLGALAPGEAVTVSVNENVLSQAADGAAISFPIDLSESGTAGTLNIAPTMTVQADSPLKLAADPLTDPAAPGSNLTYEVTYGNNGAVDATGAVLSFALPANTSFVSASGGGSHAGGVVSWNLGTLLAHDGGRQRVTVQVAPGLASGGLLVADSAQLAGTINTVAHSAQASAVSRVDAAQALALAVEVNPDPVGQTELLDLQVTVSNPGAGTTGNLALRLLYPEHINATPFFAGGGACLVGTAGCSPGEYAEWDLGVLAAGQSVTVGINENLLNNLPAGTLIPFEIELTDNGTPQHALRTVSHTLVAGGPAADSPLEIALDPLPDPVAPGGTLSYSITYGNMGNNEATNTVLAFPIPIGTTLVSASSVGAPSSDLGGVVVWNLGSLAAHAGGRESVTVQVGGGVANGSQLVVDAAMIGADINTRSHWSQAMALSTVRTFAPITLTMAATPDPVSTGQVLDLSLEVTNNRAVASGSLYLRLLYPEHINATPVFTGGGACLVGTFGCSAGEYAEWDLGVLAAGQSVAFGISESLVAGTADGIVIPFEAELLEAGQFQRARSTTVLINPAADNDLDGTPDVFDDDDDNDGQPDWWEIENGLDPFNAADATIDSDMDGLTNRQEFFAGTKPFDWDTDNDGVPDGIDSDPLVTATGACVEINGKVSLINRTYLAGENVICQATTSLSAAPNISVQSGASVNYQAPKIILLNGFGAASSSSVVLGNP